MSELGMIVTVIVSLPLSVVNIVACVHVITAAVSSEIRGNATNLPTGIAQ